MNTKYHGDACLVDVEMQHCTVSRLCCRKRCHLCNCVVWMCRVNACTVQCSHIQDLGNINPPDVQHLAVPRLEGYLLTFVAITENTVDLLANAFGQGNQHRMLQCMCVLLQADEAGNSSHW